MQKTSRKTISEINKRRIRDLRIIPLRDLCDWTLIEKQRYNALQQRVGYAWLHIRQKVNELVPSAQ